MKHSQDFNTPRRDSIDDAIVTAQYLSDVLATEFGNNVTGLREFAQSFHRIPNS